MQGAVIKHLSPTEMGGHASEPVLFLISKECCVCVYIGLDTVRSQDDVRQEDMTIIVLPVDAHFFCTRLCFVNSG